MGKLWWGAAMSGAGIVRLKNEVTGDVLEVPPPNSLGESVIILNGLTVEHVLYSDENGGSVTLGNGEMFRPGGGFADYLVEKLRTGGWARRRAREES
jgi:hypothetical protein